MRHSAFSRSGAMVLAAASLIFLCGFDFFAKLQNEEGNQEFQKGRLGKAKNAYERAKKSSPALPEVSYNLGNVYYKESSFAESLNHYQSAAEKESDPAFQSKAFYNLANALYRQKDLDRATDFYKRALRLDPKDADAKFNLERLTKDKEKQKDKDKDKDKEKDKQKKEKDKEKQQPESSSSQGSQGSQGSQDSQDSQGAQDQDQKNSETGGQSGQESQPKPQEPQGEGQKQDSEPKPGSQGESQESEGSQKPEQGSESGGQPLEEEKQDEPKGSAGQAGPEQDKPKEEKPQGSGTASGGQEPESENAQEPVPSGKSDAEARADQILNALENQEQQVLKLRSGINNPKARIRRVSEKDW